MISTTAIFSIIILAICGVYMLVNFKYDIQMLQQNSYRTDRYWRWLNGNKMTAWRLVDVALLLLLFSTLLNPVLSAIIAAVVLIIKTVMLLRRKYKKPLVFTNRVKRIYSVTAVLALAIYAAAIVLAYSADMKLYTGGQVSLGVLLVVSIFSYAIVTLALWILAPVEKAINKRYYNDAARILASMPDMKIIGITGSYGKTSTKHYLYRILSEQFDVLMTPGSYNTPMGVIRTVREMMKPYNEIFICEMGAKQVGDIKEICDLVHPSIGIVTAVGPMHLESFKTIENVQATKFELVDALPADGLALVNNDFEYCANREVTNVPVIRYAVSSPDGAQFTAKDIKYSHSGTTFTVEGPDGFSLELTTKLVGECNISNLLAAVAVALHLGMKPESIKYAVAQIEQVEHRLNMKRTAGGVTIIDDAFNSNPTGSRMAVDVISQFTGGKRIIVTPGMIELGEKQFDLNRQLGEHIGKNVDIAIVVGEYNRKALTEGIMSTGFDESKLIEAASFQEAQKHLATILAAGDVVLYENDLPDTFK